jgi:hypothetical protein
MRRHDELSFHEATVAAFARRDDTVRLALSDVRDRDRRRSVYLEVREVVEIVSDGVVVDTVSMEHEDGEVMTLDVSDENIYLIVQWNDFDNRTSVTKSYRIRGRVTVDLVPGEIK